MPPLGSWSLVISHRPHMGDDFDVAAPQRCCRLCQREPRPGSDAENGAADATLFGSSAGVSRGPGKTEGLGAARCMGKLLASSFGKLIAAAVSGGGVSSTRSGSRHGHDEMTQVQTEEHVGTPKSASSCRYWQQLWRRCWWWWWC